MIVTESNDEANPGAVLRRLRYTGGRRISQQKLADLLQTSRAHLAKLELYGSPLLSDDQLDRLETARSAIHPPFSHAEIEELRTAMRVVGPNAIEQAHKAVRDIAARADRGFISPKPRRSTAETVPGQQADLRPFASPPRPRFLTNLSAIVAAAEEDIKHLARHHRADPNHRPDAEPDVIITDFTHRNLAEEAQAPERFRDAVREALRNGATVEYLIAPSAAETSNDLVMLVPSMISYLAHVRSDGLEQDHDDQRYRAHVIPEFEHPLAYGICVAGDRGLVFLHGEDGRAIGIRTNDDHDVQELRRLLRPYWQDKKAIIEQVGRRTRESALHRVSPPSVRLRFERVLTSVELEEGPRRLAKPGLSILNIPVAIQAWKWRAAELCTAGWIPEDLRDILSGQAWELAAYGLEQLSSDVRDRFTRDDPGVDEALKALQEYARGLHVRQAAWGDQLSRHDFWDACPKRAMEEFISTGRLPLDEIPPACDYVAEPDDIEIIISRLITRLRSTKSYHLALIDELPFPQWFYLEVKATHVLAQVLDRRPAKDRNEEFSAGSPGEDMLDIHIDCAPIATAFAGWFDEHVLKAAEDPPWNDNRRVAAWLEKQLNKVRQLRRTEVRPVPQLRV